MIMSNVVDKEKLREIQLKTLDEISYNLSNSFGPMGSNTCIKLNNAYSKYTKDGHLILSNHHFNGIIEQSIVEDIIQITDNIVNTVGDGTTSAVILSNNIFRSLNDHIEDNPDILPFELITQFKEAVELIKQEILTHKRETTAEDIYNIALISTNNNVKIAEDLKQIYSDYGMEVFIDVAYSNTKETLIKVYDGMTLEAGYADTCFINDSKKGIASIRNAHVYVFEDPVDTLEMVGLFDDIIQQNIMIPIESKQFDKIIPTVILSPKLSRDMSIYMDSIAQFLYEIKNENNKPPLLIITNIYQTEQYLDLARLCKAKPIKKYIDWDLQKVDMEKGLAPNKETITSFAGHCDEVVSDALITKFINPIDMKDEAGNPTPTFNNLVEYLTSELKKAQEDGRDSNVTGNLKRRIHSLKANLVEYHVGGMSVSDRDAVKDLLEDAVKNCRSAANNGVGYGANFEGLRASHEVMNTNSHPLMINIYNAYFDLVETLYSSCMVLEDYHDIIYKSIKEAQCPINLRTKEFDGKVLSSIESDIIILESISKIVTLMFTCNQFLVPTAMYNLYLNEEDV